MNIIYLSQKSIQNYQSRKINISLCLIGIKAESFFTHLSGVDFVSSANFHDSGDFMASIIGAVTVMIEDVNGGMLDELILFSKIESYSVFSIWL